MVCWFCINVDCDLEHECAPDQTITLCSSIKLNRSIFGKFYYKKVNWLERIMSREKYTVIIDMKVDKFRIINDD